MQEKHPIATVNDHIAILTAVGIILTTGTKESGNKIVSNTISTTQPNKYMTDIGIKNTASSQKNTLMNLPFAKTFRICPQIISHIRRLYDATDFILVGGVTENS